MIHFEKSEKLASGIEEFWSYTMQSQGSDEEGAARVAAYKLQVDEALAYIDAGELRIVQRQADDSYTVIEWVKKAIMLYLRWNASQIFSDGVASYYDKIALKYNSWTEADFKASNVRIVPGARVRYGAYIAPRCIILPSFVNLGAYVGEATMIDSYATIGSCAQIGRACHISSGVVIAGVIEPIQARPTIIEDHVFIGANSVVAEGVVVRENAVLAAGVSITASTPIYDQQQQRTFYGEIPSNAVVIPGVVYKGGYGNNAAIIVKYADFETRQKVGLNMLLRAE